MTTTETEEKQLRAAATQSLFREVNEQIQSTSESFGAQDDRNAYVCECLNSSCSESVSVSRDEYERVRLVPTRFLVRQGHVDDDVEWVVESTDRYVTVEMLGAGGALAARMNPRAAGRELLAGQS